MFALFEVMDKEPSLFRILLLGFAFAILSFFSARFKPWTLFFSLPIPLFLSIGLLSEILDPYIGPSIRLEGGLSYILLAWFAPALVILSAIFGLILRRRSTIHAA